MYVFPHGEALCNVCFFSICVSVLILCFVLSMFSMSWCCVWDWQWALGLYDCPWPRLIDFFISSCQSSCTVIRKCCSGVQGVNHAKVMGLISCV